MLLDDTSLVSRDGSPVPVMGMKVLTIGDLIAVDGGSIKTGPFGTALKANEYTREGVPVISVREIQVGELKVEESTPRVSREVTDRLPMFLLSAGDIVFARKGSVDRSALVRLEQEGWFLGSDAIRLRLPNSVDPRFVAYQLRSAHLRSWIVQHSTGSTMASLNQGTIERVPLVLPPLPQQQSIAAVLGALDDKIELNRKTNRTLKALARAIFQSWFVDFDPVHAHPAGRTPPGIDPAKATFLSATFQDSPLGPIPEGWRVDHLGEVTSVLNRGISPSYVEDGGVLVLNQKCVRDGRVDTTKARRHDPTRRDPSARLLQVGDVLINSTGQGTLGRVAPVTVINEPTTIDSHVTLVRPDLCNVSAPYLHLLLERQQPAIEALGEGSTGQTELSRRRLGELRILVPDISVMAAFDTIVTPILSQQTANEAESLSLAATRDFLLPKLISGEARVHRHRAAVG